jgi:hypothetical protein
MKNFIIIVTSVIVGTIGGLVIAWLIAGAL